MSDFMSINGRGYMEVPSALIVRAIFAEMSKRSTFADPGRMDLFAKALSRAIDNAARYGQGFERVLDDWFVVVIGGTISVLGTISSVTHIGQFNVATNEVESCTHFDLVSTEDYAQLKAAMPEPIRREFKSLNAKVINALLEAVVRVYFQVFGPFPKRVRFGNLDWVEFGAEVSVIGEPGIRVRYDCGKETGEKFVAFAGLTELCVPLDG